MERRGWYCVDCAPVGKIFVQLDFHRTCGTGGTGKSSSAEGAAKAMAARMSSGFRLGKSERISSAESPAAREASTVRRVTCLPLNTGAPPQIALSRTMRVLRIVSGGIHGVVTTHAGIYLITWAGTPGR